MSNATASPEPSNVTTPAPPMPHPTFAPPAVPAASEFVIVAAIGCSIALLVFGILTIVCKRLVKKTRDRRNLARQLGSKGAERRMVETISEAMLRHDKENVRLAQKQSGLQSAWDDIVDEGEVDDGTGYQDRSAATATATAAVEGTLDSSQANKKRSKEAKDSVADSFLIADGQSELQEVEKNADATVCDSDEEVGYGRFSDAPILNEPPSVVLDPMAKDGPSSYDAATSSSSYSNSNRRGRKGASKSSTPFLRFYSEEEAERRHKRKQSASSALNLTSSRVNMVVQLGGSRSRVVSSHHHDADTATAIQVGDDEHDLLLEASGVAPDSSSGIDRRRLTYMQTLQAQREIPWIASGQLGAQLRTEAEALRSQQEATTPWNTAATPMRRIQTAELRCAGLMNDKCASQSTDRSNPLASSQQPTPSATAPPSQPVLIVRAQLPDEDAYLASLVL